jgi:hypothetical protein
VGGSLAVEVVHFMPLQQEQPVVMEVAVLAVVKLVVLLLLAVLQILVVAEVVENVLVLRHQGQVVQA